MLADMGRFLAFLGLLACVLTLCRLCSGCADVRPARVYSAEPELLAAAELAAEAWNATGCAHVEVSSAGGNVELTYTHGVWPFRDDAIAMHHRSARGEWIWLRREQRYGDASRDKDVLDLQSVITHELGHALGIRGHVEWKDATMWHWTERGDISQRTLSEHDVKAVCDLRP